MVFEEVRDAAETSVGSRLPLPDSVVDKISAHLKGRDLDSWLCALSWDVKAVILASSAPPPPPEDLKTYTEGFPLVAGGGLCGTWESPLDLRVDSVHDPAVWLSVRLDGRGGIAGAEGRVGPKRSCLACDVPMPGVGRVTCLANPAFQVVFKMYEAKAKAWV